MRNECSGIGRCSASILKGYRPVREAVNDRGLFTAAWFGVREKHCFWLKIYDRLRASDYSIHVQPPSNISEFDAVFGVHS